MQALAKLARRYGVHYRVWPERSVDPATGDLIQIGFELDLKGSHDHPARPPLPGCSECVEVYHALRRIAEWALPPVKRASQFDISVFDGKLRPLLDDEARSEVQVVVRVLHREGVERPVDDCERECLAELEARLVQLGVHRVTPSI